MAGRNNVDLGVLSKIFLDSVVIGEVLKNIVYILQASILIRIVNLQ